MPDEPEPAAGGGGDGGDGGDGGGGDGGDGGGGGSSSTADDKEESKGWFGGLFGGGKKVSEKDKEKAKQQKEQRLKEEAEAKKKKEEIERQRANREEVEESNRMAAKREKYQRLLQKNPDTTRRVFQFRMKAIKLEALGQEKIPGLSLKITLGGDFQEREEPGKGLVKKGKKGAQFKTGQAPKLDIGESHYFKSEFGAGIPVYWMGS